MDTTDSLWFYSVDETTDFDNDNENNKNFIPFKYKNKFFGASNCKNQTNGILRNATIAVPLKYLSNFWQPFEMPSINC